MKLLLARRGRQESLEQPVPKVMQVLLAALDQLGRPELLALRVQSELTEQPERLDQQDRLVLVRPGRLVQQESMAKPAQLDQQVRQVLQVQQERQGQLAKPGQQDHRDLAKPVQQDQLE